MSSQSFSQEYVNEIFNLFNAQTAALKETLSALEESIKNADALTKCVSDFTDIVNSSKNLISEQRAIINVQKHKIEDLQSQLHMKTAL